MNWKKIGLFILLFIIGVFIFGIISLYTYMSLFLPFFFIAYTISLVLILKNYSKKKLIILIALIIIYVLIIVIPFPRCYYLGFADSKTQDCTCIGIDKYPAGPFADYFWIQCVGIPIKFESPKPIGPLKPIEFEEVVLTLERTACEGNCPIYKLTIYGDGKIVYEGKRLVNVTGTQTTKISPDKVKDLVNEFYRIDYFSLKEKYTIRCYRGICQDVTDLPTTITSITIDGKSKKVENYYGAPKQLDELENKIDEITNSNQWVKGE